MKQRSREINVFSMSALDLFASALGAFILMSLIFMIFFTMTSQDAGQAEEAQAALAQCEAQLADAQARQAQAEARLAGARARLSEAQARAEDLQAQLDAAGSAAERLDRISGELQACKRALKKTFVLVVASWSTNDDVDLHVVDPQGREFYYGDKRHSGSNAALEEDNTRGPGNEIWLHPSAEAGQYRVCYKLFKLFSARGESPPSVRGSVLWQEGRIETPNIRLTGAGQVKLVVDIHVDEDGNVSLDRSRSGRTLPGGRCR